MWFIPTAFTLVAVVLAITLTTLERRGVASSSSWLYQGGAEGARAVLNTVAASLITVTGVVFSVTIVAVQLASSQYTPRVLRNFTADRGNQVVLGTFIATFTYCILVLRTIRAGEEGGEIVPQLAVTTAVLLLIVSVAALIYFINHVAREIQVTAILDRVAGATMRNVHQLFPENIGCADAEPSPDPRFPERDSVPVCASRAGYLQFVDEEHLFGLGGGERVVIGMEPRMGDFVLQGRPLASVWAQGGVGPELQDAVRRAFVLGPERSPRQDVEFGITQMADIAIKALSPSINDPTTAIRCIDRLAEILAELGTRPPPIPRRTRDGLVCFLARYTTFEVAVKVAFDEIRHFGAGIPLIAEHLVRVLAELLTLVPAARHAPLLDQANAVLLAAREQITNPLDRKDVELAAERLQEVVALDGEPGIVRPLAIAT